MNARPLRPYVADRVWLCAYPVSLAGARFDARMTVIRLASGELMLHSPCEITPTRADEIGALGPVAHIVAPGNYHTKYVGSAQAAFPNARTWICPGIERRRPDLKFDGILGDAAPADWAGEIDQVLVQGTWIMREVAMFHRASRTLILVDLIENFTDATPRVGGAAKFWFRLCPHVEQAAPRPGIPAWLERPEGGGEIAPPDSRLGLRADYPLARRSHRSRRPRRGRRGMVRRPQGIGQRGGTGSGCISL